MTPFSSEGNSTLASSRSNHLTIVLLSIFPSLRDSYRGGLSVEEMAELEEAAREKVTGISLLLDRDNEIKGIRDGTILSSKVS